MATMCKELANIGASQCAFPLKVARRLVFVPLTKEDGNKNYLSLDPSEINYIGNLKAWTDRFDDNDQLGKYYVLPVMENVTDERGDTEFFEWDSKLKVRIQQGVRTFVGLIPNEWPSLLGKLQAWEGQKFGVYIIDKDGNIVFNFGMDGTSGVALPIPVDGNSFDAKLIKATYTDPGSIMVQFDFGADVNDKDLYLVNTEAFGFDPRTSDFYSVMDMSLAADDWSVNTEVMLKLVLDYDVPAAGFLETVFAVKDENGDPVALDGTAGFKEAPDGTYRLIFDGVVSVAGWTVDIAPAGYTPVLSTYHT